MVDLVQLRVNNTAVGGGFASLAALMLTHLYAGDSSATGTMAELAHMTGMVYLIIPGLGAGATGDVADLVPMVTPSELSLLGNAVTYSNAVHPAAWANTTFRLQNIGFSTAMVDQFLIDHDAIGPGAAVGTLNIAGTNDPVTAAPSAGYTAADSLNAKGKALQVNGWP